MATEEEKEEQQVKTLFNAAYAIQKYMPDLLNSLVSKYGNESDNPMIQVMIEAKKQVLKERAIEKFGVNDKDKEKQKKLEK